MARLLAFLLFVFAVFLPGCASRNHASRDGILSKELPLTVDDLSEIKEGLANHKKVLWQYPIYHSPKLQRYCDAIAAEIADVSTRPHLPYHVTLLDSDEANIFAGPGGYLYITKGMFKYIETEGELAGLLAHEITHVANYEYSNIPHLTKVKRVYGLMLSGSELVKDTGMGGPYAAATDMALNQVGKRAPVLFKRFTADQEVETDEKVVDSLIKAGYDPREYQAFVEKLARIDMDDVGRFVNLLNSHPPFEERRKILTVRIAASKIVSGKFDFKRVEIQDFTQNEINPKAVPAPPPAPVQPRNEPGQSIVFQPKFRAVTDSPGVMDPVTSPKNQSKLSPDRKRMSTAWF